MIVVTGAKGFIGHGLIKKLLAENFKALVAVDHYNGVPKNDDLGKVEVQEQVAWSCFSSWLDQHQQIVECIFHMGKYSGAPDQEHPTPNFSDEHIHFSMQLWGQCAVYQIPLIYTASAVCAPPQTNFDKSAPGATGQLNAAKFVFDNWALTQKTAPFYWVGLRLCVVYGPGEQHDPINGSEVYRIFKEIATKGVTTLTRKKYTRNDSNVRKKYFLYVKDVANICYFLMHHRKNSGLYSIGSEKTHSLIDVASSLFHILNKKERILYAHHTMSLQHARCHPTPTGIEKLRQIGFSSPLYTLKEGLSDYIEGYLSKLH